LVDLFMRFLFRYVLPLLIALPIGFLILYPQVVRCLRISQSDDFRAVVVSKQGTPVYISHTATTRQQARLRSQIVMAYDRITRFWGSKQGQAVLIYCPQQADYEQYCVGGEGAGCSVGTPWGASYLILGPDGNNADVIAHELCHDELFVRLGWWRVKRQIPQWFNEGLALMVDYRFSSPALWEHPDSTQALAPLVDEYSTMPFARRSMLKLTELETTRDFFGGDYADVMLAYQTAADEVARWLTTVGRAGVPALTRSIEAGNDFGDAYRELERAKRQHPAK
jgi:hypothetical protein